MAEYKYYEEDDDILITYRKNGKNLSFNSRQVVAIVNKAIDTLIIATNNTITTALQATPIIYLRPEDYQHETMCTEGKFIYIQPRFVVSAYCSTDDPTQGHLPVAFAILHECMHNILLHHTRGKSYEGRFDHTLINSAMDFEVNTLIEVMIPVFFTMCGTMGFLMNHYYGHSDYIQRKHGKGDYNPDTDKGDIVSYVFDHPHYGKRWEDMIEHMPKIEKKNNQQQQQSQSSNQSQTVSAAFQNGFDDGALERIAYYRTKNLYPNDILDSLEKQIREAAKKRSAQLTEAQSVNSGTYDDGWNAGYDFIDRILNGGFDNSGNGGSSNLDTPNMPNDGSDKNDPNNSDNSKGSNGDDSSQSGNGSDSDDSGQSGDDSGDSNGNGQGDDEGGDPTNDDSDDSTNGGDSNEPNERGVPGGPDNGGGTGTSSSYIPTIDEINDAMNKAAGNDNANNTVEADNTDSFMMDDDNISDSVANRLRDQCGFNEHNEKMSKFGQKIESKGADTFNPDNMKRTLGNIADQSLGTKKHLSTLGKDIVDMCDEIINKGKLIVPDDDTFVDWRKELADKLKSRPTTTSTYSINQVDTAIAGSDIIHFKQHKRKAKPMGTEIACFIDVSGSISKIELDKFVHEVNQIIWAANVQYVRIGLFAGEVPKDGTPGNIRIDLVNEGKYEYILPGRGNSTAVGDVFRCIDEIYFDYAPDGVYYFRDENAVYNTKLDAVIIFTDNAVNDNYEIASIPQEWIDGDDYRADINRRTIWVAINDNDESFVPPIDGNEIIEVSGEDFEKVNIIIDRDNSNLIKEGIDFSKFVIGDNKPITNDSDKANPIKFEEHKYGDYLDISDIVLTKNTFELSDVIREFLLTTGFITSNDNVNCVSSKNGNFIYTDIFVSSLNINGTAKVNTKLPEKSFILNKKIYFKDYYDLSFLNGKSLDYRSLNMLLDQLAKLLTGESNMYIYDEIHRPVLVITEVDDYTIENFNNMILSKNPAVAEDHSCLRLNKAENLIFNKVILNIPSVYLPKTAVNVSINDCELAPGGSMSESNRMATKGYVDDDEWYKDTVTIYGKITAFMVEGFLIPAIDRKVISGDNVYECYSFNNEDYKSLWSKLREATEPDKSVLPIVKSSWTDDEVEASGKIPVIYKNDIQIEPKLGRKIVNKKGAVYACMSVKTDDEGKLVSVWKDMSKIYLPTCMNLPEDVDTVEVNGLTAKDKSGKPYAFNAVTMGMDGIDYIFPSKYKFVINELNDALGTNVRWINKIVNNRK